MKYIFFLPLFFICSCSPAEAESQKIENDKNIDTIAHNESDYYLPDEPVTRVFELAEMPAKWWLLTKDGIYFERIDSWDAQDAVIEFMGDDKNGYGLEIFYSHDTDGGPITNFEATITEGDGISIIEGSFVFQGYFQPEPRTINFTWNQLQRFAHFENIQFGSEYFVPDASKDFFPLTVIERED